MGLGLPIARSIIEAHNGRIRADNESTLGGARFFFELPVGRSMIAEGAGNSYRPCDARLRSFQTRPGRRLAAHIVRELTI
jgi:hypothetical protein